MTIINLYTVKSDWHKTSPVQERLELSQFAIEEKQSYSNFQEIDSGAPNGNFRENICSEDDFRSRIFGAFVVKCLACLPLLGFSNIYKMA